MPNPRYCPIPMPDGSDCWREPDSDNVEGICREHLSRIVCRAEPRRTVQIIREHCPGCKQPSMRRADGSPFKCANENCEADTERIRNAHFSKRYGALADAILHPEPPALVYYIRFGDRIKIGTTTNLSARLRALPHDEVLATEPGSYELETARHKQFAEWRVAGQREWFRPAPEILAHIASIGAGA